VSFSLSDSVRARGQVENLTLTGTAAIDATGNGLDNVIVGNGGANSIRGLGGNDMLTGGGGADRFVFDTALDKRGNVDTITDFSADDTIVLSRSAFSKLKPGPLKLKAFHEGKGAHDANDRIIYNEKTGALTYDRNGDDKGGAVKFAVLDKGLDLTSADFFVI
jgi:Ca2+-binding RTX toxin-like protein